MRNLIGTIILLIVATLGTSAQTGLRPRGDVNCDWQVDITDVTLMIDAVLSGTDYHQFYTFDLDINEDKVIDISDVSLLISSILNSEPLPAMPAYSGTLPVLFINTEGYQDIVSKDKEDYLQADWWLDNMGIEGYESLGSPQQPLGMLIKGRGNYTWTAYAKKSFRIKLDTNQPLMGMHSNRHFCLLGHPDDYLARLKNTMGFELSRRIGLAYTPDQKPVEVVLNGQYIGLYFLTEKIRVGKHRVDIEEQQDLETDSTKITGGWLLEITNNGDNNSIWLRENDSVSIAVTPNSPEVLSPEQKVYMTLFLFRTNRAIYNEDKSSTTWERYIDIDTLAMYYIVGEMMDDLEYFSGSCFMYKHQGDTTKLCFGPVWDFGNAFQRRAIYHDMSFEHFLYDQPTPFISHWIGEIAKFPHFQEVVRQHWREFYGSGFNGLDIDQYVENFVASIEPAFQAEVTRWPQYDISYQKNDFKLFIHRKINWLESQWGEHEEPIDPEDPDIQDSRLRPRGDVNCDWEVNLADLNALIEAVMTGTDYHALYTYAYDINGDREITVADLNVLIDAILTGKKLDPMPNYSGTLPVLFINTEGYRDIVSKEKEDYLHADWWLDNMGIGEYESIGSREEPLGMLIKGRGNATWTNVDKKPFRLKLDEKYALMNMPSNRHWVLLAYADTWMGKMNDALPFEIGRRLGMAWNPLMEPVEVVLNGQYIGLYFLAEKIRVGTNRVNIIEQKDNETDPEKITGGWLLEIDNYKEPGNITFTEGDGKPFWVTPQSPEELSPQQREYITDFLLKTNDAIYITDKGSTLWEQYIDIDSLAIFYIAQETVDNPEAFSGSCFMHKQRGDSSKLIFGPMWDCGSSFQRYKSSYPFNEFIYENVPSYCRPKWIGEIAKFPHFQERVRVHWKRFYEQVYPTMDAYMDEFVAKYEQAGNADFIRWPQYSGNNLTYRLNHYAKPSFHKKVAWLQSQWGEDNEKNEE